MLKSFETWSKMYFLCIFILIDTRCKSLLVRVIKENTTQFDCMLQSQCKPNVIFIRNFSKQFDILIINLFNLVLHSSTNGEPFSFWVDRHLFSFDAVFTLSPIFYTPLLSGTISLYNAVLAFRVLF